MEGSVKAIRDTYEEREYRLAGDGLGTGRPYYTQAWSDQETARSG